MRMQENYYPGQKESVSDQYHNEGNRMLLDMQGYCRITIDYHKRRLNKSTKFWLGSEMEVLEENEIILSYEKAHHMDKYKLGEELKKGNISLLSDAVGAERQLREDATAKLLELRSALCQDLLHIADVSEIFEAVTDYAALGIDRCFPRKTAAAWICRCFPDLSPEDSQNIADEYLGIIIMKPDFKNVYEDINLALVEVAEQIADTGLENNDERLFLASRSAILHFINDHGYLTKNDLTKSRLEDPVYVFQTARNMARAEPYIDYGMRRYEYYRSRLQKNVERNRNLCDLLRKAQECGRAEEIESLINYGSAAAIYDDENRRIRSETFHILEMMLTKLGLDMRSTSIKEAARKCALMGISNIEDTGGFIA